MITEALIEGMNSLDYRIVNLSQRELSHGYDVFLEWSDQARFDFACANIVWQDSGEPIVDATRIYEVRLRDGAASRKVSVGFIGLTQHNPAFRVEGPDGRQIVTVDPIAAAEKHLPALSENADIVIALSSIDLKGARDLATRVKEIDLILGGYGGQRTRSRDFPQDTQFGRTRLMYIDNQGKNVGEVRIFMNDSNGIASTQRNVVGLTKQWPEDPALSALVEETKKKINEWHKGKALASSPFADPVGDEAAYEGSERCAPCHEEEYDIWSASGHAKAFSALVHKGQDFNPDCVGCHTVGFRKRHGFVNSQATPDLINVGCESCHGPSSLHPEVILEGYGKASTSLCRSCHTPDNSPDYDPETYIPKVRHWGSGT